MLTPQPGPRAYIWCNLKAQLGGLIWDPGIFLAWWNAAGVEQYLRPQSEIYIDRFSLTLLLRLAATKLALYANSISRYCRRFCRFPLSVSTGWSKKAGPVHIFACVIKTPGPNLTIFGTLKQQFMSNTVLNDIYSYSLQSATKMKQLTPVSLQVHLSNHFDLLTWFY